MAGLARRQAALAAVALLGAVGAIALTQLESGEAPAPPPTVSVEWQDARVGVLAATDEESGCDGALTPETAGVAHPVLPCGARLVVEHAGRRAEAQVVAVRAVERGRAFDLTPALAEQLGVAGEADVRWRFAD